MTNDSESRPKKPNAPVVEGAEMLRLAVEAWKKTVDVQQHFNDLELRVRNFAITFTAAVLGLVGWSLKEGTDSLLPAGLLAIGTLAWGAFYLMDRHWYHRFLDGAVSHGRSIEDWLRTATGTEVFSLASGIKQVSGIPLAKQPDGLWGRAVGLLVRERKLRSHHRINLFYGGFFVAFAALTVVFYMHATKPSVASASSKPSPAVSAPVKPSPVVQSAPPPSPTAVQPDAPHQAESPSGPVQH